MMCKPCKNSMWREDDDAEAPRSGQPSEEPPYLTAAEMLARSEMAKDTFSLTKYASEIQRRILDSCAEAADRGRRVQYILATDPAGRMLWDPQAMYMSTSKLLRDMVFDSLRNLGYGVHVFPDANLSATVVRLEW